MLPPTLRRSRRQTALLALALTVVAALAMPAGATAAPATGTAATATGSLQLLVGGNGKAARALSARSVKVRAAKPARKRGARVTFPVATVAVERAAVVRLRGRLVFKAGRRSVALRSLTAKLTARKATIAARVGKRRGVKVLTARYRRGAARLNAAGNAAALESARIRLTPRGAKLLRKKLRLRGFPSGPLGAISLDAVVRGGTGGGTGGGGTGGGGTGGGGTGGGDGSKPKPACTNAPDVGELPPEPPLATPPPGAQGVASATLEWRPRDSWIRYINGGDGTSASGGFTNGPTGSDALVYSFLNSTLVPGKSWAHPDGRAALYFSGSVKFSWMNGPMPHCINFTASDPEIEIFPGGSSRAIFRFNGSDGTPFPNRRGVLVDLSPGSNQDPGTGGSYPDMPGTIPAGTGSSVFAGFYPAGSPFGTVTVNFATP